MRAPILSAIFILLSLPAMSIFDRHAQPLCRADYLVWEFLFVMDEFQQERHQMIFKSGDDGGADELYCPTCGRKILVNWTPEFQKTVIDPGNETAIHVAGSEGLTVGVADLSQQETAVENEEARLQDWEGWLSDMDFSGLWSQDPS
jgi:hypothetical protein